MIIKELIGIKFSIVAPQNIVLDQFCHLMMIEKESSKVILKTFTQGAGRPLGKYLKLSLRSFTVAAFCFSLLEKLIKR